MKSRSAFWSSLCLIVLASFTSGCSGDKAPTAPTPPPIAQVAGVWTGMVTQTSISGGECASTLDGGNGRRTPYTLSVTQTAATLNATASSQLDGQSCTYTGTAGTNNLSLTATSCQPVGYVVTCENGLSRELRIQQRSVTGTMAGNTLTGTTGESWNVTSRSTGAPLGIVTINYSFTFTR
jgi:hypothetical protein